MRSLLFPVAVAIASVSAGTWLAVAPRAGTPLLGVIRWTAVIASVGVIAAHLLPEAISELGPRALGAFAAGVLLPWGAERLLAVMLRSRPSAEAAGHLVALEIGYLGLVLHRFGDGLSMGAASAPHGASWGGAVVVLAIAAHIVPVTTVVLLGLHSEKGPRSAMAHGAGLLLSTVGGVFAGGLTLNTGSPLLAAWVSAAVAGLLLHIVVHDVRPHHTHEPHEPHEPHELKERGAGSTLPGKTP